MKEYKILTVPLVSPAAPAEPAAAQHPSLMNSIREFFMPTDFMDVQGADNIRTDEAERLMREMNRSGWEVVSAVPVQPDPAGMILFITFEREQ